MTNGNDIGGQLQAHHDPATGLTLGTFNVQSHWGSGVKFTSVKVKKV